MAAAVNNREQRSAQDKELALAAMLDNSRISLLKVLEEIYAYGLSGIPDGLTGAVEPVQVWAPWAVSFSGLEWQVSRLASVDFDGAKLAAFYDPIKHSNVVGLIVECEKCRHALAFWPVDQDWTNAQGGGEAWLFGIIKALSEWDTRDDEYRCGACCNLNAVPAPPPQTAIEYRLVNLMREIVAEEIEQRVTYERLSR